MLVICEIDFKKSLYGPWANVYGFYLWLNELLQELFFSTLSWLGLLIVNYCHRVSQTTDLVCVRTDCFPWLDYRGGRADWWRAKFACNSIICCSPGHQQVPPHLGGTQLQSRQHHLWPLRLHPVRALLPGHEVRWYCCLLPPSLPQWDIRRSSFFKI